MKSMENYKKKNELSILEPTIHTSKTVLTYFSDLLQMLQITICIAETKQSYGDYQHMKNYPANKCNKKGVKQKEKV